MKAQFKYAFKAGLYVRLITFAVIFSVNTVFIILGSLGLLPFAAKIVAVSLGGVAIAVMFVMNIGSDVIIARRMFASPEAYLHSLTPDPKWKILLASSVTMLVMDFVSMAIVIVQEVWLSFIVAGLEHTWDLFMWGIRQNPTEMIYAYWSIPLLMALYLLVLMIIFFCVTAKKSFLFKMPASGLLAFLLTCGCFYAVSLSQLILIPFGSVHRYGLFILIELSGIAVLPVGLLLMLAEAAILFYFTSKLMERKMNI